MFTQQTLWISVNGSLMLPILYDEHFKQYPQLQVHIVKDDSSGLKRLLTDNEIDIAFLPHTHAFGSDLRAEPIMYGITTRKRKAKNQGSRV